MNTNSFEEKYTTSYRNNDGMPCPKCNHRNVKLSTRQLRNNDEGEITYFKCMSCGTIWAEL